MPISLMPFLLLAASGTASPPCSVSDRPTVFELRALPAWAREQAPSPMAKRDEPFNPSDIVLPGGPPGRRLICAYPQDADWVVEYEQGGRGYSRRTVVLHPPLKHG